MFFLNNLFHSSDFVCRNKKDEESLCKNGQYLFDVQYV